MGILDDKKRMAYLKASLSNGYYKALNPVEVSNEITNVLKAYNYDGKKTRSVLAISRSSFCRYRQISKLPDIVKYMVSNGSIKRTFAFHLASLEDPKEIILLAIFIQETNISFKDFQRIISIKNESKSSIKYCIKQALHKQHG